jgi:hypothetical protein
VHDDSVVIGDWYIGTAGLCLILTALSTTITTEDSGANMSAACRACLANPIRRTCYLQLAAEVRVASTGECIQCMWELCGCLTAVTHPHCISTWL